MITSDPKRLGRLIGILVGSLGLLISVRGVGSAQPARAEGIRPELFVSAGSGVVFLGLDAGTPVRPNIGASVAIRPLPRLGIEFEFNKNFGHSGPYGSVANVSVNAAYFFSSARAQPYLSGGIGAFWSDPVYLFRPNTRFAGNVGLGALIPITAAISLRPEFRAYMKADLRVFRPSIAVGYHW
jgi:hypothetical protein